MPLTQFSLTRTLHLLSAAVLVGALVVAPMLRSRIEEAPPDVARAGLSVLEQIDKVLLGPATALLLVMGLFMVEGPIARFSFTAPGAGWLHIGTTLWLVLAVSIAVMWVNRARLQDAVEKGITGGTEVAGHWRWWTVGVGGASLTMLAGITVMAMKLGA